MPACRSLLLLFGSLLSLLAGAAKGEHHLPAALEPWQDWATWDEADRASPTAYSDPKKPLAVWPSRLLLEAEATGARFTLAVTNFRPAWMPLPGSGEVWPQEVREGGAVLPVVEHEGKPSVYLGGAGFHELTGSFRWPALPAGLPLPGEIGVLALTLHGQPVEAPTWEERGMLWLQRPGAAQAADREYLETKVYAALEDDLPLWLHTEVELTVAGKSREVELGAILPEGWRVASVESPLPLLVSQSGEAKVQVRAGKWTLRVHAFRIDHPAELTYAATARPAVAEELIAFRARPDLRTVEILGPPSIDVAQTTFPAKWRELPVYRWETKTPLRLEERLRGLGQQKPAGLKIQREWWLDEDGRALTFRDALGGSGAQLWRLDAAPGQELGSVRSAGQGQLVTRQHRTGAVGVEVRARELELEATGRMARRPELPASGWNADADAVSVKLNLPPGWRLLALFGADWVRGDWLTAWTLLDLFLLLIFSLAVYRLQGWRAALLAFAAFGLAYHEPGAPRFIWLALLAVLALRRVTPEGWMRRMVQAGYAVVLLCLVLVLVPFLATQVQQALYPQLERVEGRVPASSEELFADAGGEDSVENAKAGRWGGYSRAPAAAAPALAKGGSREANLEYDTKARIQTGPGVPEWHWRQVEFGWQGPVQAGQTVRPWLIPLGVERVLTILRVGLLFLLAAVLLGARRRAPFFPPRPPRHPAGATVPMLLLLLTLAAGVPARAQTPLPDAATLELLRQRLLKPSEAYPHAAEIPSVMLRLQDRQLTLEAEVHATLRTAVPLPGRLPLWSPLSVQVDGKPEAALRREDGFLWILMEPGVHRVRVEGLLAPLPEWEWTYLLKPRRVTVEAPGWTVTGVRPEGVPEAQVFFRREQKAAPGAASYERQELQAALVVDRYLELGLVWQVRTVVTRLSPPGKALALRVPLLPGENVLSGATVAEGALEARLGAQELSLTWESELPATSALRLATRAEDGWVERWHVVASPVWNVEFSGLRPVYETKDQALIPVWHPWPGEAVEMLITRPEAIPGATVTISRVEHEIALGRRQRLCELRLAVRCSVGQDFLLELPGEAEVTRLQVNARSLPVRKDGARLILPLQPGEQKVAVEWKLNREQELQARAEEVRLPVESANVQTTIRVPEERWVLWTYGPRRGPTVRLWSILACALLAAVALSRVPASPLRLPEWMLLALGLTQVPLPAALLVVGWLFLLAWRGRQPVGQGRAWVYNLGQVLIMGLTVAAGVVLVYAVSAGLLGHPEMFIVGNGSSRAVLRWFQDRVQSGLPRPGVLQVSIWWYRFAMLLWALWLAAALLRWLQKGWESFAREGIFRRESGAPQAVPPPLPPQP